MHLQRKGIIIFSLVMVTAVTIPLSYALLQATAIQFSNRGEFNTFEGQMRDRLGIPIVPVRLSDGVPQPDKQITTQYAVPYDHPNASDQRVVTFVDGNADLREQTVLTKPEVIQRGWVFDDGLQR